MHNTLERQSTVVVVYAMIAYPNQPCDAAYLVIDHGRTSLTRVDGWFISDTVEGLVFVYK